MKTTHTFKTVRKVKTEAYPAAYRVQLVVDGEVKDDFFMPEKSLTKLESMDAVKYLFPDLYQSIIGSDTDSDIKWFRKQRFRPIRDEVLDHYQNKDRDLSRMGEDPYLDMDEFLSGSDLDLERLAFWDGASWFLYTLESWDMPVSPYFHFTHNEARIDRHHFDLNLAEEILNEDPRVSDVERTEKRTTIRAAKD